MTQSLIVYRCLKCEALICLNPNDFYVNKSSKIYLKLLKNDNYFSKKHLQLLIDL